LFLIFVIHFIYPCYFLLSVSTSTIFECCDEVNLELCEKLKKLVREYFIVDNLSSLIQKNQVCLFVCLMNYINLNII